MKIENWIKRERKKEGERMKGMFYALMKKYLEDLGIEVGECNKRLIYVSSFTTSPSTTTTLYNEEG